VDNKAILRRAAQNFSDPKARDQYLALYDSTIKLHGLGPQPLDHAGVVQFYQGFWAAFPDAILTFDDLVGEGDKVTVRFHVTGTHKGDFMGIPATAKKISLGGITILQFKGGKCIERWSVADMLGLLQQLGVAPKMGG
jgi:steroid delta-isomerase-like uncharacterized protein